MKLHYLNYKKM